MVSHQPLYVPIKGPFVVIVESFAKIFGNGDNGGNRFTLVPTARIGHILND